MPDGKAPKRKYFEVFGDTISMLSTFKTLTVFLVMLCIFQVILISKLIRKPPLVIRVDSLGNVNAYKDVPTDQSVSPIEVSNFTQYFLQYFMSNNLYTYDEDYKRAFKMMTLNCQTKLNDYLTINNIVENIKINQIKSKLNVSEIVTVKDSPEYVNLKIKGTNEVSSYSKPDYFREEIFEVEMSIKKVRRTFDIPWGLLVDSWTIQYYKNK